MIPDEDVLLQIFSYLHDDIVTLRSCALVCKQFYDASIQYLYQDIDSRDTQKIRAVIERQDRLTKWTKAASLVKYPPVLSPLFDIYFPRLESVRVKFLDEQDDVNAGFDYDHFRRFLECHQKSIRHVLLSASFSDVSQEPFDFDCCYLKSFTLIRSKRFSDSWILRILQGQINIRNGSNNIDSNNDSHDQLSSISFLFLLEQPKLYNCMPLLAQLGIKHLAFKDADFKNSLLQDIAKELPTLQDLSLEMVYGLSSFSIKESAQYFNSNKKLKRLLVYPYTSDEFLLPDILQHYTTINSLVYGHTSRQQIVEFPVSKNSLNLNLTELEIKGSRWDAWDLYVLIQYVPNLVRFSAWYDKRSIKYKYEDSATSPTEKRLYGDPVVHIINSLKHLHRLWLMPETFLLLMVDKHEMDFVRQEIETNSQIFDKNMYKTIEQIKKEHS